MTTKNIQGIKHSHDKRLDNIDWSKIFIELKNGDYLNNISKKHKISQPTILKYIKIKFNDDFQQIRNILKNNKFKTNMTREGQSALYNKLRDEIRKGKHVCEKCGSIKNIEIHHIEKLHYNNKWDNWKSDNFNNDKSNIVFLCNSCHQKLHYKELGRRRKNENK